ncbi:MAG: S-adenosylmethionine:tRNA ribosyltransferase-isomerase [Myxococcota bacterium]
MLGAGPGETDLVIDGGFVPTQVDGLLTTMHDPEESHFRLLSAFAPDAVLRAAHAHASEAGYLAHELGDATLVLAGAVEPPRAGGRK